MEFTLFGRQYQVGKIAVAAVAAILIIISGVLGFFLKDIYQPLKTPVVEKSFIDMTPAGSTAIFEEPEEKVPEIKVYVTGCVNNPGVVTLKKGQVIDDAIKMAGGMTEDADRENINLAYQLDENVMLRIKSKAQSAEDSAASMTDRKDNAAGTTGGEAAGGMEIIADSLNAIVGEGNKQESSKNGLVNINKATQSELESLPNVGPSTARAIIAYREKNGGFKKLTDIMNITGIKQKTYDKLKDFICI